jgi:hypothetical protein
MPALRRLLCSDRYRAQCGRLTSRLSLDCNMHDYRCAAAARAGATSARTTASARTARCASGSSRCTAATGDKPCSQHYG